MRTPKELLHSASLEDRLEGALLVAAYAVVKHGPQYAPIVDRLERELESVRRENPTARAIKILERYRGNGHESAGHLLR